MTSVTIRMPEDVVEDLKKVAPLLGFSGYQPLIRAYIGQCLRLDRERFESETVTALVASLKRRGVSDAVIDEALSEVVHAEWDFRPVGWIESWNPTISVFEVRSRSVPEVIDLHWGASLYPVGIIVRGAYRR